MERCSPHATVLFVGPLLRRSPAQEFRGDLNPRGTTRVIGIGHGLAPFALALICFVSGRSSCLPHRLARSHEPQHKPRQGSNTGWGHQLTRRTALPPGPPLPRPAARGGVSPRSSASGFTLGVGGLDSRQWTLLAQVGGGIRQPYCGFLGRWTLLASAGGPYSLFGVDGVADCCGFH